MLALTLILMAQISLTMLMLRDYELFYRSNCPRDKFAALVDVENIVRTPLNSSQNATVMEYPESKFDNKVRESDENTHAKVREAAKNIHEEEENGGSFYQVSEGIYIYSAFVDRRFSQVTIRLNGIQDRRVLRNISCKYYLQDLSKTSSKVIEEFTISSTSFSIYADWPSAEARYHAYQYACATPKGWFSLNSTNKSIVRFSVLAASKKYETFIPLNDDKVSETSQPSAAYATVTSQKALKLNETKDNVTRFLENNTIADFKDENVFRTKKNLGLCVKAVYGKPEPERLIEWIELNKELGVEKIFFYDVATVGDARRVLQYYSETGFVDVIDFHYALRIKTLTKDDPFKVPYQGGQRLLDEQAHLVALNDCFYRQRNNFRYILIIDWDEVIVPTSQGETLVDLADRGSREHPNAVALMYSTAWHFDKFNSDEKDEEAYLGVIKKEESALDKIPTYLHMQRHLTRTPVMKHSQPKPIVLPAYSLSVNWHSVTRIPTLGDSILRANIPVPWQRHGFVHHYRKDCKHEQTACDLLLQMGQTDDIIPRYKNKMQQKVGDVVKNLNL